MMMRMGETGFGVGCGAWMCVCVCVDREGEREMMMMMMMMMMSVVPASGEEEVAEGQWSYRSLRHGGRCLNGWNRQINK